MFSCTFLLLGLGWSLPHARELDLSLLLVDAAHRLLWPGTASASPGLACTGSPAILATASTPGRVGYSSKASLEVPLPTPGRVHPGRAPAYGRQRPACSAAARATEEPEPWRKCPGPAVGQGGAGAGTALMVPSCFSSPRLEGKVDFGIGALSFIPDCCSPQPSPCIFTGPAESPARPCPAPGHPPPGQLALQHPAPSIFTPLSTEFASSLGSLMPVCHIYRLLVWGDEPWGHSAGRQDFVVACRPLACSWYLQLPNR